MIVGHLPAGYLWTRLFLRMTKGKTVRGTEHTVEMGVGIAAAVLPDIDMVYFYLVDGRQHGHHSYWTHVPVFWLCVMTGWFLFAWLAKKPRIAFLGAIAGTNLLVHMGFDSLASRVRWFYPLSDHYFNLVKVPARYDWWVLNFILHWTFIIEIVLFAAAVFVFVRSRRAARESKGRLAVEGS